MAFVSVPKDLSRVKSKVALNMTKRQLLCFGIAGLIGIPAYIITRGTIGNSMAALLMIALMFPFFFVGMYEKDGLPAEMLLRNFIRVRIMWPGKRPYKTENLYEIIEKEGNKVAMQNKTAKNATIGKCQTGKKKPR